MSVESTQPRKESVLLIRHLYQVQTPCFGKSFFQIFVGREIHVSQICIMKHNQLRSSAALLHRILCCDATCHRFW
jgi:hypothetical protein